MQRCKKERAGKSKTLAKHERTRTQLFICSVCIVRTDGAEVTLTFFVHRTGRASFFLLSLSLSFASLLLSLMKKFLIACLPFLALHLAGDCVSSFVAGSFLSPSSCLSFLPLLLMYSPSLLLLSPLHWHMKRDWARAWFTLTPAPNVARRHEWSGLTIHPTLRCSIDRWIRRREWVVTCDLTITPHKFISSPLTEETSRGHLFVSNYICKSSLYLMAIGMEWRGTWTAWAKIEVPDVQFAWAFFVWLLC